MRITVHFDKQTSGHYIIIDKGLAGEYVYSQGEVFTYQGIMYHVDDFITAFCNGFAKVFGAEFGCIVPLVW